MCSINDHNLSRGHAGCRNYPSSNMLGLKCTFNTLLDGGERAQKYGGYTTMDILSVVAGCFRTKVHVSSSLAK